MAKIIIYLIASNTPRFPYTHFTQKSLISIVINTRLLINNLRHRFPLSPSLSLNLKNSSISTLVNFHDAYKKKKKKETLYNKYTSLRSKKTKKKNSSIFAPNFYYVHRYDVLQKEKNLHGRDSFHAR